MASAFLVASIGFAGVDATPFRRHRPYLVAGVSAIYYVAALS